jgi:3-hydroxybutyryl-CoA dehydrogenase
MDKQSGQQIVSISRIGVLGAGTMGGGIALTALLAGLRVTLYDVSQEMLADAQKYIEHHLNRKRMAINIKYLTVTQNLEDLHGCDVIIEAIPEDLDLKQNTFAKIDRICPPPAILTTNTSTLSVTAIAAAVEKPERACIFSTRLRSYHSSR